MRPIHPLLSLAAISPLASAQRFTNTSSNLNATMSAPADNLVTLDVIQTRTTRFSGSLSTLGDVTLYEPVPTVVPADQTSGLLIFNNVTTTSARLTPIIIPAGDTSYIIPTGSAYTGAANAAPTCAAPIAALLGVNAGFFMFA